MKSVSKFRELILGIACSAVIAGMGSLWIAVKIALGFRNGILDAKGVVFLSNTFASDIAFLLQVFAFISVAPVLVACYYRVPDILKDKLPVKVLYNFLRLMGGAALGALAVVAHLFYHFGSGEWVVPVARAEAFLRFFKVFYLEVTPCVGTLFLCVSFMAWRLWFETKKLV